MAAQNSGSEQKPKGKPRGRPFPKGVSGNPGGRPKEAREVRELLAYGSEDAVRTLIKAAKKDNVHAAVKLLEFIIGKAPQAIQVTGANGAPLRFDVHQLTDEQLRAATGALAAALVVGGPEDAGGLPGGGGAEVVGGVVPEDG